MEKVGECLDQNIYNGNNGTKMYEKMKNFENILVKFEEIIKIPDDAKSPVSRRIKLLIKNMFAD